MDKRLVGVGTRGASRRAGLSLLECMIAMMVIGIALLALVSLITSSQRVQEESSERTIAYNAARAVLEEMRGAKFTEVYARFNSDTTDNVPPDYTDPLNPIIVTNPGDTFTVAGLIPKGDNGSAQGRIYFPEVTDPFSGTVRLTENPADFILREELGMPKDMNRDGDTDDTNLVSGDIAILPVKIVVEWLVPGGKVSKVQVVSFIAER